MYYRDLSEELLRMAQSYPVVTLIGPRQSGKTTLVQEIFGDKPYVSLENIDERSFAQEDPRGFLGRYSDGVVLDEIQRCPMLLSYIQGIVDSKQTKGMFILTGSHQLELQGAVSQSLAGRTAILNLLPLSLKELQASKASVDNGLDGLLLEGMFPRIYNDKLDPTKFYRNYVQTYVERDVRQMVNVKDLALFQQFLKLCAGHVGQIFNAHSLSNAVGVSSHTIKQWLSILEASFLVMRLQPYFENFGKRIIKSPKLYFTDVGLASYLLDIGSKEQVARDPLRGALVENLVVTECVKARYNKGYDSNLYYFRDNNGNEVDIVFKRGSELLPIEVKSSQTFHKEYLKGLKYFKALAGERCRNGYLIYAGEQEQRVNDFEILHYHKTYQAIAGD